MPSVETIRPLRVAAPGTSELKISARGPNTIFYGDNAQVSSVNKIGNLASGESLTIQTKPVWLLAEATPALIDFEEKETLGGAAASAGTTYLRPSGGDDSKRLAELITPDCDILLGPGTFLWNTEVVKLPRSATGVRIRGSGIGVTTIKLSEGAPRAFDFNLIAEYDTFKNIELSDFTVDGNSLGGKHHTVIGTKQAGVDQYLLNFEDITIRRVRTINVPSVQTLNNYVLTTNHRLNVFLASWHHNSFGNDTETVCKNILLQDCDFRGGNVGAFVGGAGGQTKAAQPTGVTATPSAVGGAMKANTWYYRVVTFDSNGNPSKVSKEVEAVTTGTEGKVVVKWSSAAESNGKYRVYRGTEYGRENTYFEVEALELTDTGTAGTAGTMPIGVNCFIDNVRYLRCRWSALGVPTEYAAQEGFQIGSLGYGGRYEMKDCYAYGSADNCFEIDGHSFALMENCEADGIAPPSIDGFTLAAFSTPTDQQETIYRNCRCRMTGESTTAASRGWGINALDSASSTVGAWMGPVTFQGCRVYDPTTQWGANGRMVRVNGDLPLLKLLDMRLIQPTKYVALTENHNEYVISWVGITQLNEVQFVLRDVHVDVQGTMKLEGHAETWASVLMQSNTFELDFDDLVTHINMPGSSAHSHEGITFPNATPATILAQSRVRRYRPSQVGDSGARGVLFADTTHMIINDLFTLEDCDFTNLGAGSEEIAFKAPSNSAKVALVRPRMRAGFPAAPSVITVTASPFVFENLFGYPLLVTVKGGTVNKIEYSANAGVTYTEVGTTAGAFRLDNADYLKVTYEAEPTMKKIPLNK